MVWDTKDKENPAINTRTQITVYSRRSVGRYKLNIFVTKRRNLRIDDLRKEENVAGELFVYTIHIKADGERDKGNHLNSGNTPAPAGGRIRSVRYENFAKFLSVFWSCSATAGTENPIRVAAKQFIEEDIYFTSHMIFHDLNIWFTVGNKHTCISRCSL